MNYFIRTTTLLLFFSISTSAQQEVLIDKAYIKATQKLLKNKKIKAAFERIEQLDPLTVKRHIELQKLKLRPLKKKSEQKYLQIILTSWEWIRYGLIVKEMFWVY